MTAGVTSNADIFDRQVKELAREIEQRTERGILLAAERFMSSIKWGTASSPGTPIDEGTARNNWITSLDAARFDIVDAEEQVPQDFRLGQTIYIQNNLPYINKLNEGHSDQAPNGFFEQAVRDTEREARNIVNAFRRGLV